MGGITKFFEAFSCCCCCGLVLDSEDPVSIWTTCLKEEVSAVTNVVG